MTFVVLKPYFQEDELFATQEQAEAAAQAHLQQVPSQPVYVAQLLKCFKASVKVGAASVPAPPGQ